MVHLVSWRVLYADTTNGKKQVIKMHNILFSFIYSCPMTSECNNCRFIREVLKPTFWYLEELYRKFLGKVVTKIKLKKTNM